jgi:trimeric autotransporter adhesin
MNHRSLGIFNVVLMLVSFALTVSGQQTAAAPTPESSAVPRIVNFSGRLTDLNGKPLTGITGVTFLLYKDEQGGAPLWIETQNVRPDETGHYTVTLGSTTSHGLPEDVFVSGEARWLAVQIQGQPEEPRVLLVAVPYALKAHDAETIGGLPPSAFMLAAPPASGTENSVGTPTSLAVPPPATSTVTTTGGTVNKLAKFNGTSAITNSQIFDNGTNVGVGNTSPGAKLDVSGGAIVRGLLNLPATAAATPTAGRDSQPLSFTASSYNSGTGAAVSQNFRWQAEPVGNNTASASGTLNLLHNLGANTPTETGLKINAAGQITFATGQTFPGVPRLGSGNTFTGNQTITGNLSVSGTITGNGSGLTNVNAAKLGGLAPGAFALLAGNTFTGAQVIDNTLSVTSGETFASSIQYTDSGVTGVIEPTLLINAVDCCDFGNRMIWAHSPAFSQWGIYYDDSVDVMHWQQSITGFQPMTVAFDTGDVDVAGTLTAGAKDFKIDHPLDPTNKYLYHASVESSEMMNIYTGNAILDSSGEAVVSLPNWFEAVNTDFRYQLTAVGEAAPNLHVAKEIANHQFQIAGGVAGMKVSWQVTGVRHDAYANVHPLVVEAEKPQRERGTYLHPDAFGKPRLTQDQMFQQQKLRQQRAVPVPQNQAHLTTAR